MLWELDVDGEAVQIANTQPNLRYISAVFLKVALCLICYLLQGNDYIHQLTNNTSNKLRIDMRDKAGQTCYATYQFFIVDTATNLYNLTIGTYVGTCGK